MAYFKRDRFAGIAPGVAPRLLADQFGQIAENVDFESGRLVSTTEDSDVFTLQNGNRRSIYYYNDATWLQWSEDDVSVVSGPIPGDINSRLYWTGQGDSSSDSDFPRMGTAAGIVSGNTGPNVEYKLGVPAPTGVVSVSKSGTPTANATPNDVSYVYTFVTANGEEGPPSSPTAILELTDDESVTIQIPSHSGGAYNFQHISVSGNQGVAYKRLYRSNTGSTNTQFQLVPTLTLGTGGVIYNGNIPYNQTSVVDSTDAANLAEVLVSGDWIGPPDETANYPDGPLQGLIPLAQGTMAGFTGKRFCLSEPFMPHAWPIQYRITTEEDIVAIASTANGVAALTDGHPYFVTGTEPSSMTAVRVDLAQACVNKRSVVDMGDYVLYAGPDGLCAVQSAQGSIATKGLISAKQWNADFYPGTIRAFRHEGTYVAFWTSGSNHGGWVYDPRGSESSLSTLSIAAEVRGGYMHPKDGQLYIIVGDKIKKYQGSATKRLLIFKSKKYLTPKPTSMGWVSVHANEYPVTVKVYGDGTLLAHYILTKSGSTYTQATTVPSNISSGTLQEPIMRLPAVVAQEWEVQVEGKDINEFCLAQSMDEIRNT